jgi:hypothetical protein
MPEPSGVPSQEPPGVPSQEPEGQPTSLEDNPPSASAAHGRSRLKKIFIPVVLFALGVLLALVAFIVVYPQPETGIPTPPYSKIEILTSVPISSVVVNVAQITSTKARMYVVVNLPQGTSAPPARADEEIAVVLPFGTTSFDCRLMTSNYCKNNTGSVQSSADEPLTFRSATVANISIVKADSNFIVNARDFGVNFNGINAYAAIPEVNLQLTSAGAESPLMSVQFHIPSAATYDSMPWALGIWVSVRGSGFW